MNMMKKKKLIIIGLGETGRLAYEYFTYDSEFEVIAFSANEQYIKEKNFNNLPIINLEELEKKYPPTNYYAFVAISSGKLNRDRIKIYNLVKNKGYTLASYVSSRAFVWQNVQIGDNCFILENNTLQPFVEIGNNVTLFGGNFIGHSSKVCNNCFLSLHVVVAGFCTIGNNSFLGVNSSIADTVNVAKDNFIGMGTIINKDTEENKIYTGIPAESSKLSAKRFCKVEE